MKPTKIIINRQKAAFNRKHRGKLPEEPTISIHTGSEIDYAFAVDLIGKWTLQQNYDTSPCGGAHIWIASSPESDFEITHRRPLSETAVEATEVENETNALDDTPESTPTPESQSPAPVKNALKYF